MNPSIAPASDRSPWKLCFLSGPLYGRAMPLRMGTNVVGSAPTCEIIVPDSSVAPRQLMFDVGGIAVSVRRRSVVPGDVITLGAIRIGIERAGTIRMPTVAAEGVRAQATAAEHLPSWLPAAAARWVARWSGKAGRGRTWLFAGIALWLAVALAGGMVAFAGPDGWSGWSIWGRDPAARAQQVRHALGDPAEIAVAPATDGTLRVTGYVPTEPDREALLARARAMTEVSVGEVYVVSELLAAAQQYFSAGGTSGTAGLSVAYGGQGRIVVSGTADRAQAWQRIRNYARDARPAVEVVDRVAWDGPAPPTVVVETPRADGLPAIVGTYEDEDGTRFVQTKDGQLYFEGARVKGDLQVKSIASDGVVLDRGGQSVNWPVQPQTP
jgi:type III secretion protein D